MSKPTYAIVETRGLAMISDGREFVLYGPPYLNLPTETNTPYPMTLTSTGEPPERVEPISEKSPMSCEECGQFLARSLMEHTYNWMYTAFGCREHPGRLAVVDIFPKLSTGTTHDWHNAFAGLDEPRLPDGVIIETDELGVNPSSHDWARRYMKEADNNRYLFTPEGVLAPKVAKLVGEEFKQPPRRNLFGSALGRFKKIKAKT